MNYNPNIHHRRSIRLKGYDYAQAGIYFLTLCAQNQVHLFGKIHNGKMELNTFGKIAQQEWIKTIEIRKNIALAEFIIMPNHIHGIIEIKYSKGNTENIGKFKSPTQTIGAIIRGYKGSTTKRIKILIGEIKKTEELFQRSGESAPTSSTGGLQSAPTSSESAPTSELTQIISQIDLYKSIWQRDYYEHIIRDEKAYRNISNYIINNSKKWEADKFHKNKN